MADVEAPVDICVDVRERGSGVPDALTRRADVLVRYEALSCADYVVEGRVGFERKTAQDLALSVIDGRLFRQASELTKRFDRPVLLIEDFDPRQPAGNVSAEALRGALISIATVFGVPILFSSGPAETAEMLATAGHQARRAYGEGYARVGYRPKGLRKRQLFVLQGLPEIGRLRAAKLLDHFGTLEAIVRAGEEDLAQVDGVGKQTAHRIHSILREKAAS